MRIEIINSVHQVQRETWNQWLVNDYPFLNYDFLLSLEESLCTDIHSPRAEQPHSGWVGAHLLFHHNNELCAILPGFEKYHSYGEYVFDWAWANAYHDLKLPYYPKLLSAAPFTPSTGPRLLLKPGVDINLIIAAINEFSQRMHFKSWHILFHPTQDTFPDGTNWLQRVGCQFHWINHNYQHFTDFLSRFSSRKRKQIKKERASIIKNGISTYWVHGSDINEQHWQFFYHCYRNTYLQRSGHNGYLNIEFFKELSQHDIINQVSLLIANKDEQNIAASLFFHDQKTLYGRYWGALEHVEYLHFECCYYQGIELALEKGLQKFDAGAQGEHKLQRGFEPTITHSHHYVKDSPLLPAIKTFCLQEQEDTYQYQQWALTQLPFKDQ